MSLSPDGSRVLFTRTTNQGVQTYVRLCNRCATVVGEVTSMWAFFTAPLPMPVLSRIAGTLPSWMLPRVHLK